MKKIIFTLITLSMALICVFAAGCSLFSAPKVAGCTYEYVEVKCETGSTAFSTLEMATVNNKVSYYTSNEKGSTISFSEDGKVTYTSASGSTTTLDYKQSGVNVLVPSGTYKNTSFNGEIVCGYTVEKKSNEILTWHQSFTLEDTNKIFDIYITYKLVPAEDTAD